MITSIPTPLDPEKTLLSKEYFEQQLGFEITEEQYLVIAKATHELALLIIETA